MKIRENSLGCASALKLAPVLLCLLIFSAPIQSYALNSDMVEGERYWIDQKVQVNYQEHDYFNGFTKYIADSDEGCFYFFTSFIDRRINKISDDNITLAFTVTNQKNTYYFQVDKDGILDSTTQNTLKSLDIYYNFEEASCKKQGGNIYVAFEFKNSDDKKLDNTIRCEYYCGLNCTYNLLESAEVNMSSEETDEKTTEKNNDEKVSDITTKKSKSNASDKASAGSEEESTKFSGSGSVDSDEESNGKFSVDNNGDTVDNTQETEFTQDDYDTNYSNSQANASASNSETGLSVISKILIGVAACLFIFGVICVIAGIVKAKKAPDETAPKDD